MTTALIYIRVSSDEQAREGLSLDTQLAECRRYAARMGWVLGMEYQDVLSGTRDDRPQYQALLTEVRRLRGGAHPVVVVVAALDRFGRTLLERVRCREELKSLGVETHSVREGGEVSDLVANILASVAQEEVRRLGERVRSANRHVRSLGWHAVGWVPWGYRWRDATPEERLQGAPQRVLEEDAVAAPYVRESFERIARGQSLHAVRRWLATLPQSARNGRAMGGTNVSKAIRNPVYVARDHLGQEDVLARPRMRWPALVDDASWKRAQEQIASHARLAHQAAGQYLLTGFLRCPACGARMCGRTHVNDRRYVCIGHQCLGVNAPDVTCRATVSASRVDRAVLAEVVVVLQPVTALDETFRAALRREWEGLRRPPPGTGDTDRKMRWLVTEAERARERLRRATDLFVDGQLTKADYDDKSARERAALEATEAEIARLGATFEVAQPKLPSLETVLARARGWDDVLQQGEVPATRAILVELVEGVVPIKVAYATYRVRIAWTSVGAALQALRSTMLGCPA